MRRFALVLIAVAGLGMGSIALADCGTCDKDKPCPTTKPAGATQYVCSMCDGVTSDKPGKCPKCGMKLVEKKAEKADQKPDSGHTH